MDGVIKNSRRGTTTKHASSLDHQRMQKSSTLNRKFVRKPVQKPKIVNNMPATAKSLRRQSSGGRTLLRKNGNVRLRPISEKTQSSSARTETKKVVTEKSSVQAAVRRSIQTPQAQRKAVVQQIAQKRKGDVYIKNAQAQAAKQRIAAKKAAAVGSNGGVKRLTSQQMKDRAIQQALDRMNQIDQSQEANSGVLSKTAQIGEAKKSGGLFKGKRLVIATSMAVIAVALLGYLVYLNIPDLSARVAAMHAGIEKSFPSYIPANYRLDGLAKEDNGRITMNFKDDRDHKFTLQEEKSSWDSAAVLANYVKKNWGTEYSIAKGQGLTIYISDSNAVWVNGGVLYIISDDGGGLNSSDLHDIAVSL